MSKRMRTAARLYVLGMAVAGCTIAVGCVSDPPPFNPLSLQRNERELARDIDTSPMRKLPTTLENPYLPPGVPGATTQQSNTSTTGPTLRDEQIVRLSLQELIQRSVTNSYEVRVAGYDPAIEATRIVEAQARFDPTLFASVQREVRDDLTAGNFISPPDQPFATPQPYFWNHTRMTNISSGIRQTLQSGGQAELRYDINYTDNIPARTIKNPFYENELVLEVTQPLLRDFGTEINTARITIARNTQRISVLEFRKTLEKNITEIEQTYWSLVAAEQNVRTTEMLVANTEDTASTLSKRFGEVISRVQVAQANSSVETRRAALIRAKSRVQDLSDHLKRLVNDPDFPITGAVVILPATPPVLEPIHFDIEDQINTAMENRPELAQQQLRVNNTSTVLEVAKNNLLPQLNFGGKVGLQSADATLDENIEQQSDFNHWNYRLGLQLEIPIGNRAARAIYERSRLQRQQAIEQYQNIVAEVAENVRTTMRDVRTSWDEIVARRQAVFAAQDALLAIQQQQDQDTPLTAEFVNLKLDRQADVAQAQAQESEAIASYNTAIANLEAAKGTLLRYNNILLTQDHLPTVKPYLAK